MFLKTMSMNYYLTARNRGVVLNHTFTSKQLHLSKASCMITTQWNVLTSAVSMHECNLSLNTLHQLWRLCSISVKFLALQLLYIIYKEVPYQALM